MLTVKDIIHDFDNQKTMVKFEDDKGNIFETTYNGIIQKQPFERALKGGLI